MGDQEHLVLPEESRSGHISWGLPGLGAQRSSGTARHHGGRGAGVGRLEGLRESLAGCWVGLKRVRDRAGGQGRSLSQGRGETPGLGGEEEN